MHASLPTYLHTYIPTYLHTYVPTYPCTYVHTYIDTYIHTYVRTYIHTYIHTYVYIYIHIYIWYMYINTVCVCAHSILKWYHMLWQSVFLLMSIQMLEVCDLCCMLGRYPEGDALTLNAPWHADHWEKLFSRCLKTLVWLFWPKMLACLGGFGQGLCTQLVFFIIFEETHINYITGSNLVPIIPLLLADVVCEPARRCFGVVMTSYCRTCRTETTRAWHPVWCRKRLAFGRTEYATHVAPCSAWPPVVLGPCIWVGHLDYLKDFEG